VDAITVVLAAIKDVVARLDSLDNTVKLKSTIVLTMVVPTMPRALMASTRIVVRVQQVSPGNFVKSL